MKAWTYSSLEKFETCPKQYYHVRIARDFKEPQGEAALWGETVHTAVENYILNGQPLPDGMKQWTSVVDKFNNLSQTKLVEHSLAVDKNFQPTEWGNAWTRGIADFMAVNKTSMAIVDWKTGKRKPSEQLALYAAMAAPQFPEVQKFHTAFVWLKERKITKETYTRDQIAVVWQKFLPRVRRLEIAYEKDEWPARPSGLCKGWCCVTTCTHYKPKK